MMKHALGFCAVFLFALTQAATQPQAQDKFGEYRNLYDGGAVALPGAGADFGVDMGAEMGARDDDSGPKLELESEFYPPVDAQPGMLTIRARIPDGWYIYSISQPRGGPVPTELRLPAGIRTVGNITVTPAAERKFDKPIWGDLPIETHRHAVEWRVPFFWAQDAAAVDRLSGDVAAQMCDPNTCMAPKKFPFQALAVPVPAEGAPVAEPAPDSEPAPASEPAPIADPAPASDTVPDKPLWIWLVYAFLGGLILNLMPCVLPVIAPKLYSFIHQAGESRSRVFQLNFCYVLGLLTVFWILAGLSRLRDILVWAGTWLPEAWAAFLPQSQNFAWGSQFQYASFDIFMVALVFVMGLSFLGVWEIPIPGFIAGGKLGDMQRKEGLFGSFCMGILTTLLATPCVGPFLGPVFGFTMTQAAWMSFLIFTVIGLGLAAPYLIVGAFPALVRFLPKPGEWMEILKEVMGFFFLGGAVWLMYILMRVSPGSVIPTLALLVGLWFACWLVGRVTRSGAETPSVIVAWASGIIVASVVGFGMFHLASGASSIDEKHRIQWQEFSPELVEAYRAQDRVVFIDFTASWCATCQWNTILAIETERVGECIHRNGIVAVLADFSAESPVIQKYLLDLNRKSIPLVAIWVPGREQPLLLDGFITEAQLLEALETAASGE